MKSLTPKQLAQMAGKTSWIMPYRRLTALVDGRKRKVLYIEEYGPERGFFIEGWRALHYPLTSSLVEKTYREGDTTICLIKQGSTKLKLVPSFAPLGIESCAIKKGKVQIGFAGLGGAGVSASYSRGLAEGVEKIQILEKGGGRKLGKSIITLPAHRLLLIGVDDTDNEDEGATYSLVHNIAQKAAQKTATRYSIHGNVQLYPYNKQKTRNCFATVVGIIFTSDEQKKKIIAYFKKSISEHTLSPQTAMAYYDGFVFNKSFIDFCTGLKYRVLENIEKAKIIAKRNNIKTEIITGERGLIGAIGSLAFFDQPDFAVKLPNQCQ